MSHGDKYRYGGLPAGCFRLLELLPGTGNTAISVSLHIVDELQLLSYGYQAISYAWGDPRIKVPLICEGKILEVTPNLRDCLRRLRLENASRLLWADAVCINQRDLDERGQQVTQMHQTYHKAQGVIVWLGADEYSQAKIASRTLARISEHFCKHHGLSVADLSHVQSPCGLGKGPKGPPLVDFEWEALTWFFERPWFSRLWVLQEIASSNRVSVYCGDATFNWEVIGITLHMIRSGYVARFQDRSGLKNAHVMRQQQRQADWSTARTLGWGRRFHTTEPLDRVYAMLAFTAVSRLGISADYKRSEDDLCLSIAVKCVQVDETLEILSSVHHETQIVGDLPSWVPRWSQTFSRYAIGHRSLTATDQYSASGQSHAEATIDPSSGLLRAEGIEIDVVERVIRIDTAACFDTQTGAPPPALLDLWDSVRYPAARPHSTELDLSTLASTLAVRGSVHIDDCSCQRIGLGDLPSYLKDAAFGSWKQYAVRAQVRCRYRSLVSTQQGYLGLAPDITQAGDVVCLLFGGIAPFVLRPRVDGGHRLVGDAYVHEYMDGLALRQVQDGTRCKRLFEVH